MIQFNKILVVCPAGAVTGGPEALHQLVDHMNHLGLPAYVTYLPFDRAVQAPEPYQHYNAPVAKLFGAAPFVATARQNTLF
jgi:hypothetical protein